MARLAVAITIGDLERGERSSTVSCPIALAFERLFRGHFAVAVDGEDVELEAIDYDCDDVTIPLPPDAMEFISRWDRRLGVEPAEFVVAVPGELLGIANIPPAIPPGQLELGWAA